MSYKVFSNGNVLNASELNEFLMNQSVIAFSNATARSSAITSPVEGMITYLEDSNSYQSYDGSAWVGLVPQSANAIMNGAFEINQRGFTSTTVTGFGFDRWSNSTTDGTVTFSSQTFTLGSAPVSGYEGKNFIRIVTSGQTATNAVTNISQPIESVRSFAGENVTVSFWAKAATGTPKLAIDLGQNFGSGGSPSASVFTSGGQVTLSTNWARYSATVSIPSILGKTIGTSSDALRLVLWASAGSDFNSRTGSLGIQSNTFDIWGVQLEAGPVATPFKRNANSLQGELAACQRYYYRAADSSSSFGSLGTGWSSSTTAAAIFTQFPVNMRVKPTSIEFGNTILSDGVGTFTVSTITLDSNVSSVSSGATTVSATGQTQFRPGYLRQNSNSAGFLAFSAEL
jgi:hypothetical protein